MLFSFIDNNNVETTNYLNNLNMTYSMLEYSKMVLKKVSFDLKLFCKELEKAISRLMPEEIEELKDWLYQFITDKPELKQSLIYIKA
ncbi:hypothetical protein LCGC14_0989110 [marine sediment metagenome]